MEKNKNRVLAYQLAVPLSHDALDTVSGGGVHLTNHNTVRPSGSGAINQVDIIVDVSVDW